MAITEKSELAECFQDTLRFIDEDSELKAATRDSEARTRVYPVNFAEEVDVKKEGRVLVFRGRTLREAMTLHAVFPDKRIAVLSFAASRTPGGGGLGRSSRTGGEHLPEFHAVPDSSHGLSAKRLLRVSPRELRVVSKRHVHIFS